MPDWYVIVYEEGGTLQRVRIVAGPLTLEAANEEAHERIRRKTGNNLRFAVVQFDPFFGLVDA